MITGSRKKMSKMELGETFCDHDKSRHNLFPWIEKRQKMFPAPCVNFEHVFPDPACALGRR